MNLAVIYLIQRFLYRILEFLRHWYIKSLFIYSQGVLNFLEKLDRIFALKITLRYFFKPLYKDYSFLGYILGFLFRFLRVLSAILIYLMVIIVALFLFLLWLFIPVYLIFKIIL